jgi:hypothetical protein
MAGDSAPQGPKRKTPTMSDKTPAEGDDTESTAEAFHDVVNMTPARIEHWLGTDESKRVGYKSAEGGESVGHHSGRRIIEILKKKKGDLDEADTAHMRKVVGYVHRHLAQKPEGDVRDTNWRYSLMNWGHDPLGKS